MLIYSRIYGVYHHLSIIIVYDYKQQLLVGGLEHGWNIFHFIYGMSSETHWRSPSFFKMVFLNHQPVLLNGYESKPSTQTVP